MSAKKPDAPIFFEPHFPSDLDEEGPRDAMKQIAVELGKPDPDLNAIREWLRVEGLGYNRRFMVSTFIERYQQAAVGKPSPEDLGILRELLGGLLPREGISLAHLRDIARKLPASRLASSDPEERAAGERLRERIARI